MDMLGWIVGDNWSAQMVPADRCDRECGIYATKLEAVEGRIEHLESERRMLNAAIAKAKRKRAALRARATPPTKEV